MTYRAFFKWLAKSAAIVIAGCAISENNSFGGCDDAIIQSKSTGTDIISKIGFGELGSQISSPPKIYLQQKTAQTHNQDVDEIGYAEGWWEEHSHFTYSSEYAESYDLNGTYSKRYTLDHNGSYKYKWSLWDQYENYDWFANLLKVNDINVSCSGEKHDWTSEEPVTTELCPDGYGGVSWFQDKVGFPYSAQLVAQSISSTYVKYTFDSTDGNSHASTATSLSVEFKDEDLQKKIKGQMPALSGNFVPGSGTAFYWLSDDHIDGRGGQMEYRVGVPNSEKDVTYTVVWSEVTSNQFSGSVSVAPKTEDVKGTGDPVNPAYGKVRPVQMPENACSITTTSPKITKRTSSNSGDDSGSTAGSGGSVGSGGSNSSGSSGCSTCGTSSSNGNIGSGPVFSVSMGTVDFGQSAGSLLFGGSVPTAALSTPLLVQFTGAERLDVTVVTNYVTTTSLTTNITVDVLFITNGISYYTNYLNETNFVVITNLDRSIGSATNITIQSTYVTNAIIRQVNTPQVLADIPTPSSEYGYVINFYYHSQVSGTDANGLFLTNGTLPFATWVITNADHSSANQLQISETTPTDGVLKQWNYTYSTSTGTWLMQTLAGGIQNITSVSNLDGSTYWVLNTLQYLNGPIAQQTATTYKIYDWGTVPVQIDIGNGDSIQRTAYTYNSSEAPWLPDNITYPNGSVENYTYNTNGQTTRILSTFKDNADGRETTYDYTTNLLSGSTDDGTVNPTVARQVIEKIGSVEVSRRYAVFPSVDVRLDIQCTTSGSAWNDTGNLVTTSRFYANGPNQFALQSVLQPNGTMTFYSYQTNANYRTNITVTGQPDSTGSHIVDGVSNQVVVNKWGGMVEIISADVKSGAILVHDAYGNHDGFGRPQQVTHLDQTVETTTYACCGIANKIDRDGVNTVYLYDADRRQYGYAKYSGGANPVIYQNTLDAAGRTVQTTRIGTDNSTIVQSQSAYDAAGRLIAQTNALGGGTTYIESNDPSTGNLIRSITNPDNGTRIETYYLDGTLKSVTGTAAHPVSYDYGAYDGGTWVMETKGNENGNEWTKTYTDMAGRTWKTEYPNNAVSTNCYNLQGQLWKQVDPDEVTTFYSYNAKGELAFTAISKAGTAAIDIDWDHDRITQTTNDVINDNGTTARRSQTFVWLDNPGTGTLASVSETSVDGLKSWQVNYGEANGGKPVTSSSITSISGSGRTTTATAPDGSRTVSTYSYGRLLSSARFDAGNNPLGSTDYTWDAHGRTYQVTDARNGATTYEYNDADQVNKVTTPVPGGGQPAEITATHYNTMLQPDSVTQPDGNFVTNVYLLTGELGQQSGSRTYPVGYGFDYAGRMQFMTNWSSFCSFEGKRVTTWNYNEQRGWLTKKIYPDAVTGDPGNDGPSYDYTPAGRLKTRNWVRGVTTTYTWDSTGSMTNIAYSDITPAVTYGFDRLGRLTTASSGGTTETLTYNLANELLSDSFSGGILDGLTVTNSFDAYLRRSTLSALAGSQTLATANYSYINDSRLSTVSDGNGNFAIYSYLANSPLVSQIAFKQNGTLRMTTTKQSDFLNRLKQISSVPATNGALPLSFHYNYNSANQRTKSTLADGSFWEYQFDSLGQVTNGVKHFADGTLVPGQSFGYLFDDIGNRKQTTTGGDAIGASLRLASYSVNSLNQITNREYPGTNDIIGAALIGNSVSVNGNTNVFRKGEYFWTTVQATNTDSAQWLDVTVASGGKTNTGSLYLPQTPENFVYDLDGNLISDGLWTNTWNAENRLIASESSAGFPPAARMKEEWSYLPDGRWSQRIVSKWISDAYVPQFTNKFVWDGKVLMAIVDHASGLVMSFLRGTDLSGSMQGAGGVGGLLAVNFKTNGTHFAAFDGNGNVAGLVSAADGSTSANYEYGPFGEAVRITGPVGKLNPIRFSTQFADDVTGVLKYLHRPLGISTGTWLSRDPIQEDGGVNLYCFCVNRPTSLTDLNGLDINNPPSLATCPAKCGLKKAPEYNRHGTMNGSLGGFTWDAKFRNDGIYSPSCCEVHQYISSSKSPLHSGFPSNMQTNTDYEDRDRNGKRYGHRSGQYSDPQTYDYYYDGGYYGADQPSFLPAGTVLKFHLIVVDICNKNKTIYTSQTLTVKF